MTDEITKFFSYTNFHSYIGLKIYLNLIEEIQVDDKNLYASK